MVEAVNATHRNPLFLPDIPLPASIEATGSLNAVSACDALLIVVPAQHIRRILSAMPIGTTPLVLCAKGIEADRACSSARSRARVHPDAPIAVISGPTFAFEVAQGKPTAVTLACDSEDLGARLADRLAGPTFRPYFSSDVIGAEIGGAVKNVLRHRLRRGRGSRAWPECPRRADRTRLCRDDALRTGARARVETLAGLSGLGDLVLTCSSTSSSQLLAGHGPRPGQVGARPDGRSPHRGGRRLHRARAAGGSGGGRRRHARHRSGLRLLDGADVREVVGALLARPLTREDQ